MHLTRIQISDGMCEIFHSWNLQKMKVTVVSRGARRMLARDASNAALLPGIDGGSPMRMADVRLGDERNTPDCRARAASTHLTPAGQSVELDTAAAVLD